MKSEADNIIILRVLDPLIRVWEGETMKSFKKFVALSLLSAMALSLAGCRGKAGTVNTSTSESTAVAETTVSQTATSASSNTETETAAQASSEETYATREDATVAVTEETGTSETSPLSSQTEDVMTSSQRNSVNMLNYMSMLTRKVDVNRKNQLSLEDVYNSFDNLYPNSVDKDTQKQITSLMDTIQNYRMISVKRERLKYIYDQNCAQAYKKAVPNPKGVVSAAKSGSKIKIAAAVVAMVIDSKKSYDEARSQADLEFLKGGWELDDEESAELHNSTKNALNYMIDMVRTYDIPGDRALNKGAIEDFVTWSGKEDSELERKITWFEDNKSTYAAFGPYWLELARDYYKAKRYTQCLEAVHQYESVSTRIFRKDKDYASILPMAIVAAKETMNNDEYVKLAGRYCEAIHENTQDKDWILRYYSILVYVDIYSHTNDKTYIDKAYNVARENVNYLVDDQKKLNNEYLSEVKTVKAEKNASKREKKEINQYNKAMKAERKIALPPVSEALYLNAETLFGLAEEKNISDAEKQKIDNILHENGQSIFLTKALDDRFWFTKTTENFKAENINMEFDGSKIVLPASCFADRSRIYVLNPDGWIRVMEWEVTNVKRPKNSNNCDDYMITLKIKDSDKYKYQAGQTVTIMICLVENNQNFKENLKEYLFFKYNVVESKTAFVIKGIKFVRAK